MTAVRARACANIALAKYWGKAGARWNVPAVPSISMTLDALVTETTLTLDTTLAGDVVHLDGQLAKDGEASRAVALLDDVRARASGSAKLRARVESRNLFPTASGLASSASGFAALAAAACAAYGVDATPSQVSAIARRASASAARSVFGGFVELPGGGPDDVDLAARPIAPPDHWDVAMVIALVTSQRKKTSSRDGMTDTAKTSPYHAAWLGVAPLYCRDVREGILARDLGRTGRAMAASTMAMHAAALAAVPAIRYMQPATIALLEAVDLLRERDGVVCFATMDAGPHVKVLCASTDAPTVANALEATGVTTEVRIARPGPAATVEPIAVQPEPR